MIAMSNRPLFPIWTKASIDASKVPLELFANGGTAWMKFKGIINKQTPKNPNTPEKISF